MAIFVEYIELLNDNYLNIFEYCSSSNINLLVLLFVAAIIYLFLHIVFYIFDARLFDKNGLLIPGKNV